MSADRCLYYVLIRGKYVCRNKFPCTQKIWDKELKASRCVREGWCGNAGVKQ